MSASPARRPAVRDDLVELSGYHSPQVTVDVRLNTNESPVPPPPGFRDALAAEVARVDWHRYPDRPATELRAALAELHGVDPSQIFCANGSNEVLQTLLLTYGGPGRTAATFEPTYALHAHISRITGTSVAVGERTADFTVDPAEARRVLDDAAPAVTFLCSPNNPTGTTEAPATIREVAAMAEAIGSLVVIDEAYGQFASWSALELIDEDRPLVVTRTYSKTWSMAAVRLGYLIGPSWVVAELEKVVLPYHLDAVTQIAGRVALRDVDAMNERVAGIVAERDRVSARLGELPVTVWPSGSNFVLFRPEQLDGHEVWQRLLDRSVLIRDCSSWPRLTGCLRATIGTQAENDAFLDALTEALR